MEDIPNNHLGWNKNPRNNGIKYQPQLEQNFFHQRFLKVWKGSRYLEDGLAVGYVVNNHGDRFRPLSRATFPIQITFPS